MQVVPTITHVAVVWNPDVPGMRSGLVATENAAAAPLPIAATIALEMIGPMPGTVMTLRQLLSLFAKVSISSVTVSIRSSSCRQSLARSATMRTMRGERTSVRLARMSGSVWRRKRSTALLVSQPTCVPD